MGAEIIEFGEKQKMLQILLKKLFIDIKLIVSTQMGNNSIMQMTDASFRIFQVLQTFATTIENLAMRSSSKSNGVS